MTEEVPWGYICGFPTQSGDLYGGGHYFPSATEKLTKQGRAIRCAVTQFCGQRAVTLNFSCCKKGFVPLKVTRQADGAVSDIRRMYACGLHHALRKRKKKSFWRDGQLALLEQLWSISEQRISDTKLSK